jgi:hypothetical protein
MKQDIHAHSYKDLSDEQLIEIKRAVDIELAERFPSSVLNTHLFPREEFVDALVSEKLPIPPKSNPFHYDPWNSGTDLSRGWIAMFSSGSVNEKSPLKELYLHNSYSGQRIQITLVPKDLSKRIPI